MKTPGLMGLQAFGGQLREAMTGRVPAGESSPHDEAPSYSLEASDYLDSLYRIPAAGHLDPSARSSTGGARVSFLRVLPGMESPYLVRHRRDEVVYVVTQGRGQFLVDGEAVDAPAGTVLRVRPESSRAWRNLSTEDFCLIVVQTRARRPGPSRRSDAVGLAAPIRWPR
ncbi:cupin domain-containing protein [Isosphaeraceae bacterium EP7]